MDNLEVKIEAPEGFEIDRDNSTIDCIQFKKKESWKIGSWTNIPEVVGFFVDTDSIVCHFPHPRDSSDNRDCNVFAYRDQAEACLALAQLSQLMKHVNGEWKPDWESTVSKFVIEFSGVEPVRMRTVHYRSFLAFEIEEKRDWFFATHAELIKKALPLL
jgi:hypothetical protein